VRPPLMRGLREGAGELMTRMRHRYIGLALAITSSMAIGLLIPALCCCHCYRMIADSFADAGTSFILTKKVATPDEAYYFTANMD